MNELKVTGNQRFMGKEIPVVSGGFGEGKKCVTDKAVAEIHNMREPDIRRRITDNIKRFKEGVDFIDLKSCASDAQQLLNQMGYSQMQISKAEHIYILSERGYAKLIKIMDTDLAWEIHDKLIDEYFQIREGKRGKIGATDRASIMLMNARSRMANTYLKLANVDTLSPTYKNVLVSKAGEVLAGEEIIPLPKPVQLKTYSASELGEKLGISAQMVGRLSNKHGLKTKEYGEWQRSKSPYSSKECDTFVYYESAIQRFKEIAG
ncbi:MAG: ORF6N domain-containing protein [Lachnospiraceae bacterium]